MACQIPPPSNPNKLMVFHSSRFRVLVLCLFFLLMPSQILSGQDSSKQSKTTEQKNSERLKEEFFEKKIRPVLIKHCYECHSRDANKNNGGLFLDTAPDLLQGGDMGAAIVPGKPDKSLLLQAMKYEDLEMPPDGKLDDKVIADFEKWINGGAFDPRKASSNTAKKHEIDWDSAKKFWSLQPPRSPALPKLKNRQWTRNRIDYFVLAKLEANGLSPAPAANERELTRRLAYDLTGLPPSQVETSDSDQLVDNLLGSSAFGEKWARLWMDVSRYAEDQAHIVGNNKSLFYPNAYWYRDWVIDAFNQDLPYDQFVSRQLAADLIAKKQNEQPSDYDLSALGFIGLGPKYYRRNTPLVMADEWEDRIDTVSRGLLGLTVACARCHDHKYDPISTKDYYALAGVFASTEMYNKPVTVNRASEKENNAKKNAKNNSDKNKKKKKTPAQAIHIVRDKSPKDIHVQIRGDASSKGEKVERRFLTILDPAQNKFNPSESGRLELARAKMVKRTPVGE